MSFEGSINSQYSNQQNMDEMIDIRKYIFLLWNWAWLIVLAAMLAGGIAYFVSKQLTPIYATTTELLVIEASSDRLGDYQDVLTSERLTQTYADIMTNQDILQEVIDILSLDGEVEFLNDGKDGQKELTEILKKMIEITPTRDTQLITVSVEGENPALIADIANTVVSVFSDRIRAIQTDRYSKSIESLSAQMKDIDNILQDIQKQVEKIEITAAAQTPEAETGTIQPRNNEKENLEAQALQ